MLNASAITYLNLALLIGRAPQQIGIVGLDGVPLQFQGSPSPSVQWVNHIGLPPGSPSLGELVAQGIKAFKKGMQDDDKVADKTEPTKAIDHNAAPSAARQDVGSKAV